MFKKLLIVLMVLGIIFAGSLFSHADTTRTIPTKAITVTSNTVVSAQGCVVYKVTGYANASNATYALSNSTNASTTPSATEIKVEGGEATQYDSLPTLDFGSEGLVFDTGLTVFTVGSYLSIEYV